MGNSFGDRHDETQFFVSSNKEDLCEANFRKLQNAILFFAAIYAFFLILSYVGLSDFVIYPSYFLVPFVLLFFWKVTDIWQRRPDRSFEAVRLLVIVFDLAVCFVTILIDFRIHPESGAVLLPMALLVLPALYVDYFVVLLGMELAILAEFVALSFWQGRTGLLAQDGMMCLVAITLSMYGYWVALGIFTDDNSEERVLKEEGTTDLLTGLLNKMSFEKASKKYLKHRAKDEQGVLFIIDFDNFKSVNDEHGHLIGDAILRKFGDILKKNFRESDIVGRVGGDEFMVMMTGNVPEEIIAKKCNDIQHELNISKIGEAGGFSCSIGVTVDEAQFDFDALYKLCDDALYEAKARGKARYVKWESRAIEEPDKTIIYIATPHTAMREQIKKACGINDYVFMESETASKALNEISLYQDYLESVFFDYKLPDMDEAVLHKYMNSRPIFSQIPVHDIPKEL